ncbi:MAG: Gfo/Idh/MocA family oxidoreductase [Chloroflexi bacterium]|nr:Gfo/Idh/MocA family oxidoreductase [Chloroflexota bacterium]
MTVEVGFIGTGGIANQHLNGLERIADARVTAVFDIARERAEAVARRFNARVYSSHQELIEKSGIQALYVCLPPFAHEDQEILAAHKGIALFVEKPVAISYEKAREVLAAIRSSGVLSAAGYHWRYNPLTDRARELLKDRAIGMVHGYWHGGFPQVPWWRQINGSGGQFVEQTTHIVDLARYLAGEIIAVQARYAVRTLGTVENFSVWDTGTVNIEFASGAIGNISNSCMANLGYTVGLHVICPGLIVEEHSNNLRVLESSKTTEYRSTENAYFLEDQAFIKAVAAGDASFIRSPYEDAVRSLFVTLAANESATYGKTVAVQTV